MEQQTLDALPALPAALPATLAASLDANRYAGRDLSMSASLDAGWQRRLKRLGLTPGRRQFVAQFLRFGVVGLLGFMWDTATVYGMRPVLGLTGAMILAYFVAASMNWLINRLWTFRGTGSASSLLRQWGTFIAANSLGFLLNRGTALALVDTLPVCNSHPVLALVAGTAAGMFSNFTLSRRLVFR